MNNFSRMAAFYALSAMVSATAFATDGGNETNADSRFFYIGAEAGIVEPVKNKFIHKSSKTAISLKRSGMYSGKFGYSFYPQMAIEFSGTVQPKYNLSYTLPERERNAKIPGRTKVASEVYMVNFIYDFANFKGFTPFVILGGGMARIKVKPTSSNLILNDKTIAAIQAQFAAAGAPPQFAAAKIAELQNQEVFRVKKTNTNCMAWQVGLGISKDIGPNLSIDLAGKLQVVHNVKIKYDEINTVTRVLEAKEPIKKTLGVWEIGVGFTYKLPI